MLRDDLYQRRFRQKEPRIPPSYTYRIFFFQETLTSRDKDGTSVLRQLNVFVSGGQVDLDL
jgi:hypothetical protein